LQLSDPILDDVSYDMPHEARYYDATKRGQDSTPLPPVQGKRKIPTMFPEGRSIPAISHKP